MYLFVVDVLIYSLRYLDFNGTTPLSKSVQRAMHEGLATLWGNAGTVGVYGERARAAITTGTQEVARLIGCNDHNRIVVTSGGTESNSMAIRGAILCAIRQHGQVHCVTSTFEHPAVANVFCALEKEFASSLLITRVSVSKIGIVDEAAFKAALKAGKTRFVSIMHANNEVGSVQNIAALVQIAKDICGSSGTVLFCPVSFVL
jgi:cysteine desulfurase